MKKFNLVFFVLCGLVQVFAQPAYKIHPSAKLQNTVVSSSIDTIRILAVMVEFQTDNDATTVGNGKFDSIYTQTYDESILDPLPHDSAYFAAHLEFARNYFRKVSGNKTIIDYTVLPQRITVSKTMKNYSPPIQSTDFLPVAQLIDETWKIADTLFPNVDFSAYNLFAIFHAGVGRDVSLPGSLGNERDIPSIFMGLNSLQKYFGASYSGVPVRNGSFSIKNSMILPQTQNRELESFGTKYLVEITINGLIVSSIASYLGLPDLFDTKTGLSAIGRFGLMDGQSIFAYNGVFPPQPSAWERIHLGWASVIEIKPAEKKNFSIKSFVNSLPGDSVIYKIPINASEYFLVENRQRDVNDDGAKITIRSGGSSVTKTFSADGNGFYSFDIDSLHGVITDVDEFDWAVPGSGIVIWHIDEETINQNIATNTINADKKRRGVDVEEADGIQDIGEEFQTIFGDIVVGEGSPEDFWFAGNPAKLYSNRFDKNTFPASNTNSGAYSYVTMSDFSDTTNTMTFSVIVRDTAIAPHYTRNFYVSSLKNSVKFFTAAANNYFAVTTDDTLNIINLTTGSSDIVHEFSDYGTAVDIGLVAGSKDKKLNLYKTNGSIAFNENLDVGEKISTAPVIGVNASEQKRIYIGTESGKVITVDPGLISGPPASILQIDSLGEKLPVIRVINSGTYIATIKSDTASNRYVIEDNEVVKIFTAGRFIDAGFYKNSSGTKYFIVLRDKNIFDIWKGNQLYRSFSVSPEYLEKFSTIDLTGETDAAICFVSGNKLFAYNINGALIDNFPVALSGSDEFTTQPIGVQLRGNSNTELLVISSTGAMYAFDGANGKVLNDFPISFSRETYSSPYIFTLDGKTAIAAISKSGGLTSWFISTAENQILYTGTYGDGRNSLETKMRGIDYRETRILPLERVYNYPNPVYDNRTAIRYYTSLESDVTVRIFDASGDKVTELKGKGSAGFDNEIIWDVSEVQSGIYLAQVEVSTVTGLKESTIIKIAVVH